MLEHVTLLEFPTFLSANTHVPLAVAVSLPTSVPTLNVHVVLVLPSYTLLLQLVIVASTFFFVILTALVLLTSVVDKL